MVNSSMPWVKLYTELLTDQKVAELTDSEAYTFIRLILLAGECDADGLLINGGDPLTDKHIAWWLRKDVMTLCIEIAHLIEAGLIDRTEDGLCVTNFAKRQGRSQSDKRAQWRNSKRNPKGIQKESNENPLARGEERREEKKERREEEKDIPTTFTPPPSADVADSTGQIIATEEARNSEAVRLWRKKLRRPLSPEATNAIYETATDTGKLEAVIDYWLIQGWANENVNGILSMYRGWDTDRRNPKNQKSQPAASRQSAPVSYFGEGGTLDRAMQAVWGDMGASDGN